MEHFELPPEKQQEYKKAKKLEWWTIAYLLSAIAAIYATLGSSQAMKTAWAEDMLSLIPAIAFLVASRYRNRSPNKRFAYGYHRSVSVAFLCAAVALFFMGLFLLYDALSSLAAFEHPSIGVVQLFGHQIWLGWLMLPALVWSAIPAFFLGRAKIPLARSLHDKVLYGDAVMNKADWLTAGAAMVGVIGIGFGLWWADAVAAAFISLDIIHDGYRNLKAVVADLMDERPKVVDDSQIDPLPERVRTELCNMSWVKDAQVRMREEGHVFFGEAFVVPRSDESLTSRIKKATNDLKAMDWRLHDLVLTPVEEIPKDHKEGPDEP
jgi:cation diffusion facilitator family transporter